MFAFKFASAAIFLLDLVLPGLGRTSSTTSAAANVAVGGDEELPMIRECTKSPSFPIVATPLSNFLGSKLGRDRRSFFFFVLLLTLAVSVLANECIDFFDCLEVCEWLLMDSTELFEDGGLLTTGADRRRFVMPLGRHRSLLLTFPSFINTGGPATYDSAL